MITSQTVNPGLQEQFLYFVATNKPETQDEEEE